MANVGGQAVLEGVMMRGASNWAVAVRKPDGDIAEVHQPIKSPMARHWIFRLPVIRGVVALGESLAIGFRALAISANYAAAAEAKEGEEGEEVSTELTRAPAHLRVRDRNRVRGSALQGLAGAHHRLDRDPAQAGS